LLDSLQARQSERRELSAINNIRMQLPAEEIRTHISGALTDIPKVLAKSPQLAKAKLSQYLDNIRMLPKPDGT
jgi:hypothetical protein